VSFLALGDSYTIGESVAPEERWVSHLARMLRERGLDVADPRIVARTGWTTTELATAMDGEVFDSPYDLVTLLIGVNDQYRGGTADDYRPRFRSLLAEAVGLAGGEASRVVVLAIPDWGKTPYAQGRDRGEIRRQLDAFNATAREETLSAGARWVDITPIADRVVTEPELVASDGLHPSGAQYRLWAEAALDAAESALRSR
jgi:lysophospholipase L1-like esterase